MRRNSRFFLCIGFLLCFLLTGCGGSSAGPEKMLETFCTALQQFDAAGISACMIHATEDTDAWTRELEENFADAPQLLDYLKEQASKIEYSIGEPSINGDSATVQVTFTHADMTPAVFAAAVEYVQQALILSFAGASEDRIEQMLYSTILDKLQTTTILTTNTDVIFSCLRLKDGWKIDSASEDALTNVMTCNMLQAFEEVEGNSSGERFLDETDIVGDPPYEAYGSPLDDITLNGISYWDAIVEGWGDIWYRVADHIGTDGFLEEEAESGQYGGNGNAWDDFDINGIPYELAQKYGWGDDWMAFINHVGSG